MKQFTIILAIMLLIVAFTDLSAAYSFYTALRLAVCACAVISAVKTKNKNSADFIILCIVAILFNPITPFHFGKFLWKIIDGGVGFYFIYLSSLHKHE